MESWRFVWRNGFIPALPESGLRALLAGLKADDRRLAQGSTTTPPPLMCVQDWPVEAADAVAFACWQSAPAGPGRPPTVGDVEEGFARACHAADNAIGEPAACRWFLNWYDDTPRPVAFAQLAEELEFNLGLRAADPADAPTPGPAGWATPALPVPF